MTPDRIRELFEAMRDRDEGVNTFIMTNLMNTMLGRSLEAVLPLLEQAHGRLEGLGNQGLEISEGRTAHVVQCPEGPHGGVWRKAIAFEGAKRSTVTMLQVGGEPNPMLDRIVAEALASKGLDPTPAEIQAEPCRDLQIYRITGPRSLAEVIDHNTQDKWHPDLMLDVSLSIELSADRGWMESYGSVATGHGLDGWYAYFRDVSALFGTLGLTDDFKTRVDEVAGRNWLVHEEEIAAYAASHSFGLEAALQDGYLPGAACLDALNTLDRMAAEHAMSVVAPELQKLPELLQQIDLDADGDFSANDGRNVVRLLSQSENGFSLQIQDQNNLYLIQYEGDQVTVRGERGSKGGIPCLDLGFQISTDGAASMQGDIGQSIHAIRAWNSFKSNVATLVCCAEEEIKHRPQAAPGGRGI